MFMPPKPASCDAETLPHKRSLLTRLAETVTTYGRDAASARATPFTPAMQRPDLRSRHAHGSYRLGAWGDTP
jgi:hypothetical protein